MDSSPLTGAWKLISFELEKMKSDPLQPFGEDPHGTIIYADSGYFSVQVMRRDRPSFESGDQMQGTPEEIAANYQGVISYYGTYEVDEGEGFVLHHVEGSLFPNWECQPQKRFFHVSGDRLELRTPPTLWDGGEVVGVLIWDRVR